MDVIYFVHGEEDDIEVRGRVNNATDFLQTLELVDIVTLEMEEYRVISTELVVGEGEPYLVFVLESKNGPSA